MKGMLVFLFSFVFLFATGEIADSFERCIMCGMDADISETKYTLVVEEGCSEIKKGNYGLCCLHCLVMLRKNLEAKGGRIGNIQTRDYNTKEMVDAGKAFYLIESTLIPKGSMVPFILAFQDRSAFETFQKVYGGALLDWEGVVRYVIEYKY